MKKPEIIDIGFKIPEEKLWAADVISEKILISEIDYNLDIPYLEKEGTDDWNLSIRELVNDLDSQPYHAKGIRMADVSYPIELYYFKDKWIILDGVHRLASLVFSGKTEVRVRRFSLEDIEKILRK